MAIMRDLGGFCALSVAGGWAIGAAVVVAVLLALLLAFSFFSFCVAFYAPKKKRNYDLHRLPLDYNEKYSGEMLALIDGLAAVPCEKVSINSADGLKLYGRYYASKKEGAPVHIMFNGYRGLPIRDFSGGCSLAREEGHEVLLVDQRAHGDSDGSVITFGIREKNDVLAWINYAIERFGERCKIILSGVSMGAATVLEAGGLKLPDNVVGIIADCPFSSPEEILCKSCKDRGYPVGLTMFCLKLGARLFGGFKIEGGACEAVKRCKIPVLIIHGGADTFVPCEMSKKIYAACASEKYLYICEGADHGISYLVDTDRYKSVVRGFLEKILHTAA